LDNNLNRNVFEMDKKTRLNYLENLAIEQARNMPNRHEVDDFYSKIYKELERISEIDVDLDFLVAKSIADILSEIASKPNFVGMGCSSIVAYLIGITGKDPALDPIKHGLVFERVFQKDRKGDMVFGFYVENEVFEELMQNLKVLYGENISLINDDIDGIRDDRILVINNIGVRVSSNFLRLRHCGFNINELLDESTVGFFTEDYMHLLHYAFGYSYDEANSIRLAALKTRIRRSEFFNVSFDSKFKDFGHALNSGKDEELFDQIIRGLKYSRSKAWVLSAQHVWNAYRDERRNKLREKRLKNNENT
jgi:hypothetical protein